ncbi:17849_t:CDS:2, partial [Gigaspora margarita]
MVLISSSKRDYVLTPKDLPSSSPLLIYSAIVVADSYISNNQGSTTTNVKGISEVEFDEHLDVQKGTSSVKMADTGQSSSTTNFTSTLQNTSQHISSRATRVEDEEDAAFISNDEPTELVQVQIQDAIPVIKEKHGKNL